MFENWGVLGYLKSLVNFENCHAELVEAYLFSRYSWFDKLTMTDFLDSPEGDEAKKVRLPSALADGTKS